MSFMKVNAATGKPPEGKTPSWRHPGGKLRELGAQSLSDAELLAVLISSGIKGRSAETIAGEIIETYGSLSGMSRQPLEAFLRFKGMSDVKILRIAAALEIARRLGKGESP
jgi:DNA repair protein RadC